MNNTIDLPKEELMKKIEEVTFNIDKNTLEISEELEDVFDKNPSLSISNIIKENSKAINLSKSLIPEIPDFSHINSTLKLSKIVADSMKPKYRTAIDRVLEENSKAISLSKTLIPDFSHITSGLSLSQVALDAMKPQYNFSECFGLAVSSLVDAMKVQFDLLNFGVYKSIVDSMRTSFSMATSALKQLVKIAVSYDNINRLIYKRAFEEHKVVSYKFYQSSVFPPINYFIDKEIYDIDSGFDIEEFILSDEVNEFYLGVVRGWKNKYRDEHTKMLISDIEFNLKSRRSYAIVSMVPILIEHMLNDSSLGEYMVKTKGQRYPAIRLLLEEKVFNPLNVNYLHRKFINNNLYSSTKKAEEFSRHMTHGDRLEFGNMKTAMNMIFIYDFLQKIIVLEEKEEIIA